MVRTTCTQCGGNGQLRCDRCNIPVVGQPLSAPPPFGSFNAASPLELCVACYVAYAMLGWSWIGRTPADTIERLRDEMYANMKVDPTEWCECERWRNGAILCPIHGVRKKFNYSEDDSK